MALFAWTQDVPIDASAYADVKARMGTSPMPGLLVHLAVETETGRMHYIDVWESEESCEAAFEAVVHPAVRPVLVERRVAVRGEPPRTPLNVIDVRFADGTSRA